MIGLLGLVLLVAERVLELRVGGLTGIDGEVVRAAIILAVGVLAARVLERHGREAPLTGPAAARQVTAFRYLTRFVLYLVIVLAMLAAFGVGLSSVVFGGAFLTVIVGLAGQTVFGNLLAGLVLILFHPFSIGDRISFMTWQYPILMPSFPHEALTPAYAGTVTDVSLLYTTLELDSGLPMAIPNGIALQAAVMNHARGVRRYVRVRFDVDLALDPGETARRVAAAIADLGHPPSGEAPTVSVADLGPATFALLLRLPVAIQVSEDAARDMALRRAAAAVRAMRLETGAGTTPSG